MSRPRHTTKLELDPQIQARIITFIQAGAYVETAAKAAGIHKDTLYDWLKRGAGGEQPFADFSDAVEKALAEAELRDVARIDRAAESQWQAAAWKLERRNPKTWGPRGHTEITGQDGGPIRYEHLTESELDAEIERLTSQIEKTEGDGAGSQGTP